jgi:uncharacterized protein (UPF0332 family)
LSASRFAQELLIRAQSAVDLEGLSDADRRRTISDAYYSVFHLLVHAATESVTADARLAEQIARQCTHSRLKDVAERFSNEKKKAFGRLWAKESPDGLREIAEKIGALQELRHRADYGVELPLSPQDMKMAVEYAVWIFEKWKEVLGTDAARAFLLFLLLEKLTDRHSSEPR